MAEREPESSSAFANFVQEPDRTGHSRKFRGFRYLCVILLMSRP